MATPTNAQNTYAAIGNREDLSDMIYDVSKAETFFTMIPKVSATATKHEWQTDILDTADGTNAVIEGSDATTTTANTSTRYDNYTQISTKVPQVTGTQDVVNKAGRATEMAYQIEKKLPALKRDVDAACLLNQAKAAGSTSVARTMAGAQTWIVTNQSIASDATAATGDGSDTHTDGTPRALVESYFETVLGSVWNSGGNPSLCILGLNQKKAVAGFSGNATRTVDGTTKKVTNTIDVYIDPLGSEVRLVPNRQCPTDVVYFFDPMYVKFAPLRDFGMEDLAKNGDSDRKLILVEATLEMCNEAAHGIIADLS